MLSFVIFTSSVRSAQAIWSCGMMIICLAFPVFKQCRLNTLSISKAALADLRKMVATGAVLDASPTRWGYANECSWQGPIVFLCRSSKLGFCADSVPTLASICAEADDKLFWNIQCNQLHLRHHLFPHPRDNHYSLSSQTIHNLQLPLRISSVNDWHFFLFVYFLKTCTRPVWIGYELFLWYYVEMILTVYIF